MCFSWAIADLWNQIRHFPSSVWWQLHLGWLSSLICTLFGASHLSRPDQISCAIYQWQCLNGYKVICSWICKVCLHESQELSHCTWHDMCQTKACVCLLDYQVSCRCPVVAPIMVCLPVCGDQYLAECILICIFAQLPSELQVPCCCTCHGLSHHLHMTYVCVSICAEAVFWQAFNLSLASSRGYGEEE